MGRSRAGRLGLSGLCCALALAVTSTALAQSAADKATARQVALEGIGLYQKGEYDEALDLLKRAQALYDAPPHLLYIARCQARLEHPQLVEAAENYRLVVNKELAADAPDAFKQAQADAQKELAELEPRIPSLQIDVTPADAADIQLTIDGVDVAAAVIGIPRPVNPGQRKVAVVAKGYEPVEKTVDVPEGEAVQLPLALEPASAGAASASPSVAGAKGGSKTKAGTKPGLFGFMLGLRLGGVVPGGSIGTFAGERERPMSDLFKGGGALELHGGMRFARYVTAALFAEGSVPAGGDKVPLGGTQNQFNNTATTRTLGVKVMVGTPRNQLGGFGEVGFGQQVFTLTSSQVGSDCRVTTTLTGTAVRVGGGAVFPVGTWLHLVPFGALSFGAFGSDKIEASNCLPSVVATVGGTGTHTISSSDQSTHTLLMFGVGGDWVFGADATK